MDQILKLSLGMKSLAPVLACEAFPDFRSELHSDPSGNQPYSVIAGQHQGKSARLFFVDGHAAPSLAAYTLDFGDRFRVDVIRAQGELPAEMAVMLATIGAQTSAPPGAVILSLDCDAFEDRVAVIDRVRGLGHRAKHWLQPDQIAPFIKNVFQLASWWRRIRALEFERRGSECEFKAFSRQKEVIVSEIKALRLELGARAPIVVLEEDVRGPALNLIWPDNAESSVMGLAVDWASSSEAAPPPQMGAGKLAVTASPVPPNALAAIRSALLRGNAAILTAEYPPKVYAEISEWLTSMGGRWNTGRQAFEFDKPAQDVLGVAIESGFAFTRKDFEFFWTPEHEVQALISELALQPGMKVLEPNAGQGGMALPAAKVVGIQNVQCYELMPENVEHLKAKGLRVGDPSDFLEVEPQPMFDAVLMNPPFSKGRDIAHILHAMKFLKPGGVLGAICSPSWRHSNMARAVKFREMLSNLDATIKVIDRGAFKDSGYMGESIRLVLRVPRDAKASAPMLAARRMTQPQCERLKQDCLF